MEDIKAQLENAGRTDKEILRDKLLSEQKVVGTLIGGISGGVPGFLLYIMLIAEGGVPLIAMLVPGLAVGFGAKLIGRGIDSVHSWIAAGVAAAGIGVLAVVYGVGLVGVLFSAPNIPIAGLIAKRTLSFEEDKALYDYRMGRGR